MKRIEPESARPDVPTPAEQTAIAPKLKGALTDVLPGYMKNPAPVYPRLARLRGYEGTVLLDVEVLPSGRVGRIAALTSSGHDVLDRAALSSVRNWRFQPARRWRTGLGPECPEPDHAREADDGHQEERRRSEQRIDKILDGFWHGGGSSLPSYVDNPKHPGRGATWAPKPPRPCARARDGAP